MAARDQEVEDLRDQLTVLRSEKESWEEEVERLKERAGIAAGEKEQLEVSLADLGREHAARGREMTALREELSAARAQVEEQRLISERLQARMDEVERESYRRIEDLRDRSSVELEEAGKEIEASRQREREALLEQERLRRSLLEGESRLASGEEALRRALDSGDEVREELARVRGEAAKLSLELGRLYMKERSWEKAAEAFRSVLRDDRSNGEAYYSLGEIYYQLGQFDLSKEMFGKAKDVF